MAKQKNILIGGLLAIILVMVVGYAAFASQLNITGTGNITSNWKIKITKITSKVLEGSAIDKGTTIPNDLTATFKTSLQSPGDKIQYNVEVSNQGDLDAVLDTINLSDSKNPAIKFASSGMEKGTKLPAGSTKTLTITVEYDSSITDQPESTTSDLTASLTFVQDDGTTLDTPTIHCDIPSDEILGGNTFSFTPIVTGANGEYTGEIHVSIVDQNNISYFPINNGNNTFSITFRNETAEYTITISTDKTDLYSASSAVYILKVKKGSSGGGGGSGGSSGTTIPSE